MPKFVTPISFVGGPRDGEADVFNLSDKVPHDIYYSDPPGTYRVRRLVDTRRYVFLWVPR